MPLGKEVLEALHKGQADVSTETSIELRALRGQIPRGTRIRIYEYQSPREFAGVVTLVFQSPSNFSVVIDDSEFPITADLRQVLEKGREFRFTYRKGDLPEPVQQGYVRKIAFVEFIPPVEGCREDVA